MALNVLQINLNNCAAAQDLMFQTTSERRADLVLVSEQHRSTRKHWISDASSRSAIYHPGCSIGGHGSGNGWVWAETGGVRFYSCYFSPNRPLPEFSEFLEGLITSVASHGGPVIVAGDFNAKAADWGSSTTNRRGELLCEALAQLRLHPANEGTTPTFRRGSSRSVIDVTFAHELIIGRLLDWRVLDAYSHSDHQYICFRVAKQKGKGSSHHKSAKGWSTRKMDVPALLETINQGCGDVMATNLTAQARVDKVNALIGKACDASMPKRSSGHRHKPVYWWNDGIAGLRRVCLAARRRSQRKNADDEARLNYIRARKELRDAIKKSKARCWEELLESVERDPWGLPYKIVRQKLRGSDLDPFSCDAGLLQKVVGELFPTHAPLSTCSQSCDLNTDPFTREELASAAMRLKPDKAPGPDGVPNVAIRAAVESCPEMFLSVYNSCLKEGVFGEAWKIQRLVLVPKPGNGHSAAPSYRPLCMLDGLGKLMERLVLGKLENFLESQDHGLSPRQYGFRKGRSTVGAIAHVVDHVRKSWKGTVKASAQVVMVAIDIKNAFNSASWEGILRALRRDFHVPESLAMLIENYFSNRQLVFGTTGSAEIFRRDVSAGVPQGSVLGPALWNALYDGLLRTELPTEAQLVAFADDVALLVTAKRTETLQIAANEALRRVKLWLDNTKLDLAVHKTEAIHFTRRRRQEPPSLMLGGFQVPFVKSIRYLGVHLDAKLNFSVHVEKASAKAAVVATQIAKLMPNIGGPKSKRRKLLSSTVHSVMLYAAPVWASSLNIERTRLKMARVQRICALRVISGYRTVSEDAALVLAGLPPVDLLAAERGAVFGGEARWDARVRTFDAWQQRWSNSTKGEWTRKLVGQIKPWCERKHGEMSFHLTQLFTGHGCFGAFLKKIGKEATGMCHHCDAEIDDAKHTFFECSAWEDQRSRLVIQLGAPIDPANLVQRMLSNADAWAACVSFAAEIMKMKEAAERVRRLPSGS